MIKLENVTKIYAAEPPITALSGITLQVPRSAFVAIVGRSGSGKSTLLNIIGGLTRPNSGRVFVDGADIVAADDRQRAAFRNEKIGFVFQSFHVTGDRTALDNVMLPARFSRGSFPDPRVRAMECLNKVNLSDRADSPCNLLSGGQIQRVAIARAIFMKPPILLADEPTGNLDTATGMEILDLFSRLHRHEGLTLVVVTHEESVARAADKILTLENGKLVEGINK
jgi:putative ABC transport system ATP-binding protein